MKIIIVEDDHLQYEQVEQGLQAFFKGRIEIERVSTEHEFCEKLPQIVANPPDIIVMDVMLRWANPSPNRPPMPKSVAEGGFFRAGMRCEQLLADTPETAQVPVIIYSILTKEDIANELLKRTQVSFLPKDSDFQPLIHEILNKLGRTSEQR